MTKNSETEISRCFVASDSAVTRWAALGSGVRSGGGGSDAISGSASLASAAAGGAFFSLAPVSVVAVAPSPKRSSWGRTALPFFVAACAFATAVPLSASSTNAAVYHPTRGRPGRSGGATGGPGAATMGS